MSMLTLQGLGNEPKSEELFWRDVRSAWHRHGLPLAPWSRTTRETEAAARYRARYADELRARRMRQAAENQRRRQILARQRDRARSQRSTARRAQRRKPVIANWREEQARRQAQDELLARRRARSVARTGLVSARAREEAAAKRTPPPLIARPARQASMPRSGGYLSFSTPTVSYQPQTHILLR